MRNDRQVTSESFQSNLQSHMTSSVYKSDQSFKEFIKSNLKTPKVSKEFIQSIKEKVKIS
jgi:hypothetical protein